MFNKIFIVVIFITYVFQAQAGELDYIDIGKLKDLLNTPVKGASRFEQSIWRVLITLP
jgi:hypothetical protein